MERPPRLERAASPWIGAGAVVSGIALIVLGVRRRGRRGETRGGHRCAAPSGARAMNRNRTAHGPCRAEEDRMAERIDVQQARRKVSAGEALLVCGYDDEAKCERIRLEGAISLKQLEARADEVPRDREIIFYCA
jgi:hypothetical protein